MKRFGAILIRAGAIHRLTYEAGDEVEARQIAVGLGVGFEGEAVEYKPPVASVQPEAFCLTDAQRLLGNISRATIYRWLADGTLQRVAGTRRLLITRKSIVRLAETVAASN